MSENFWYSDGETHFHTYITRGCLSSWYLMLVTLLVEQFWDKGKRGHNIFFSMIKKNEIKRFKQYIIENVKPFYCYLIFFIVSLDFKFVSL